VVERRADGTTIAYFTGDFVPADKASATRFKVHYPDGTVEMGFRFADAPAAVPTNPLEQIREIVQRPARAVTGSVLGGRG
jgi:hypothetical protein